MPDGLPPTRAASVALLAAARAEVAKLPLLIRTQAAPVLHPMIDLLAELESRIATLERQHG